MLGDQHHVLMARLLAKGRLRHLHLIGQVAETGSIQQAAARVGMSQPAATHAIRDIETLLGAQLFERHARGMRPTQKGRMVADYAHNMLSSLALVAESLARLNDGVLSVVRIGTIPAAASTLLAEHLPAFIRRKPHVHFSVEEGARVTLLPALIKGDLDIIFCRPPEALPYGFEFEPLLEDKGIIVGAPDHPLTCRETSHRLDALADYPWVAPPDHAGGKAMFDAMAKRLNTPLRSYPISTVNMPLSVMVAILQAEPALCLMPRSLAQGLIDTGLIAEIELSPMGELQPLGAIYHTERLSTAGRALLSDMRAAAQT